jgi:hypothetical protein
MSPEQRLAGLNVEERIAGLNAKELAQLKAFLINNVKD